MPTSGLSLSPLTPPCPSWNTNCKGRRRVKWGCLAQGNSTSFPTCTDFPMLRLPQVTPTWTAHECKTVFYMPRRWQKVQFKRRVAQQLYIHSCYYGIWGVGLNARLNLGVGSLLCLSRNYRAGGNWALSSLEWGREKERGLFVLCSGHLG